MAFEGGFGGHFGVALGALAAYGDDFGVTLELFLGSVWGHFGSLDGHFAMVVESLWVYEGPFSKSTHFPHRF